MNTTQIGLDTGFRVGAPGTASRSSQAGTWLAWAKGRLQAIRRLRQRRRAINELARMSDWRLADMGIARDQIPEVIDGLIAREGPSLR